MNAMEVPLKLAAILLEHTPEHIAELADVTPVGDFLHSTYLVGQERWPEVTLPAEVFVRHLAERLPAASEGGELWPRLEALALVDLYLACACARGEPKAVEALERYYLSKLPGQLAHLKRPPVEIEEVCQRVRLHVLVGTDEARPRIAEYTGRGSLLSWLRVVAVRMALKQHPAKAAEPENVNAALGALPAPGADAELDLIKRRYHYDFRQAVREAFAAVGSEQRHVLRLYFLDQLTTTELGKVFGVNPATVSRWLKSARRAVYEETKRRLQERLRLSSQEFASMLAVLDSQLDMSLSQVLKKTD